MGCNDIDFHFSFILDGKIYGYQSDGVKNLNLEQCVARSLHEEEFELSVKHLDCLDQIVSLA